MARDRARSLFTLCLAALMLLAASAVTGCSPAGTSGGAGSGAGTGSGGGAAAGPARAALDTEMAIEGSIVASDGAVFGFSLKDAVVRITFPLESLSKDTSIVVTPYSTAPGEDAKTLVKGFYLEEKGAGKGPALKTPAYIEMIVAKELPEGTALVSYGEDGKVEVLPTKMKVGKGVTALFALAPHFSGIGGRDVGKSAGDKARDQFSDYDWVVYINNKQTTSNGPLQQSVKLTLRASNSGGDIAGDYTGNATIVSSNSGNIGPMVTKSPQTGKSDSVKIKLTEGDPLASLTPEDPLSPLEPDPLAPLSPPDLPRWFGSGSITMSAMNVGGSASGYIGGYGGSGATKNTSTLPVTMQIEGTQVSLTVSGLPGGSMTFKGYVIGEGKK